MKFKISNWSVRLEFPIRLKSPLRNVSKFIFLTILNIIILRNDESKSQISSKIRFINRKGCSNLLNICRIKNSLNTHQIYMLMFRKITVKSTKLIKQERFFRIFISEVNFRNNAPTFGKCFAKLLDLKD